MLLSYLMRRSMYRKRGQEKISDNTWSRLRTGMYKMNRALMWLLILLTIALTVLTSSAVDKFMNKCLDSKNHKSVPGPEGKEFVGHCRPWSNHSCCTGTTAQKIETDGILSLYNMLLDQCPSIKVMSNKCKRHFKMDTCFYECSPNLAPWIVDDKVSKKTRTERIMHIPLCASDCDQWFEDCKFDYTCSDNWGIISTWNWKKKGTPEMCTQPCKTFKEYFGNPKTFCERLFNYSYKYGSSNSSECMSMWPTSWKDNLKLAQQYAKDRISKNPTGFALKVYPSPLQTSLLLLFIFAFL